MKRDRDEVERFLESVGEAITDETPVAWDALRSARPDLEARIERLRTIEKIAAIHRAPPSAGAQGVADERYTTLAPTLFRWGPLEVLERVGEGSFGEVFRARDTILEREVALKLWPAPAEGVGGSRARRALDEARQLARVRHQNILVVHGADIHGGRFGLWTDLVRGKTLEERLENEGPLGAEEARLIGVELCRALAAIHAAGLVHGDVKAANVMREIGGRIVLADFGSVSELLAPGDRAQRPMFGSPLSTAPEVLSGATPTAASDLYALGVLLYRLVSGRYPISAESVAALVDAHAHGARVPLRDIRPDLPPAFVQVIERTLAGDPRTRYESAGAMEAALLGESASPTRSRRARPIILAAGAGLVVVAALLGLRALEGSSRDHVSSAERNDTNRAITSTAPSQTDRSASDRAAITEVPPRTEGPASSPPMDREGSTAVASATPSLRVEASLHRVRGGLEENLASGAMVRTGEELFLRIEASAPMHTYVLDEDEAGSLFVLFPAAGLDVTNPLEGGVAHRLPGTRGGIVQDWQMTSAGGKEWILVIASREPLSFLESEIARLPAAEPGRPLEFTQLRPAVLDGFRGIGRATMSQSTVARETESRLAALARRMSADSEGARGVWVRLFELHGAGS